MRKEDDIKAAADAMKRGGVILYPTDTVWGIGCDATNEEAVRRVYEIKRRDSSKSLICLVDSEGRLARHVRQLPDVAWDLLTLSQKPTTVILDGVRGLAPSLYAEDGSVGIRITREDFSRQLCYRMEKPIVSTSANFAGEPAAQNYSDISPELLAAVDYVCLSRRNEHLPHVPSSVIKLSNDGCVQIIRR